MIRKSKNPHLNLQIENAKVGIIASRFNDFIVDKLITACIETLHASGLEDDDITLLRVPGAFEIPVAAQRLIKVSKPDAVIALGTVIRGETPHFDYICNECSSGLTRIALDHDLPVVFGVLTVDTEKQAMERAGKKNNKGKDAALAAIEMINVLRNIS